KRSRRMVQELEGPGAPVPESNRLCLDCHVHPSATSAPRDAQFAFEDGVGCESCHGPAQEWLAPHSTYTWGQLGDPDKVRLGLRPTKDLIERARGCVGCHVGAPGRDVNHDLLAAGHPRLNFEYGAFLANVPKHWDERRDKARSPDLEARAWAIGQ